MWIALGNASEDSSSFDSTAETLGERLCGCADATAVTNAGSRGTTSSLAGRDRAVASEETSLPWPT